MSKKEKIEKLKTRIEKIKTEIMQFEELRPGSLGKQYNVCGNPKCRCKDKKNPQKHGPYYQLSYTHKMKSRTQYVRRDCVDDIRGQIEVYKRFRKLIEKWIDLSIEYSQMRMKRAKEVRDP